MKVRYEDIILMDMTEKHPVYFMKQYELDIDLFSRTEPGNELRTLLREPDRRWIDTSFHVKSFRNRNKGW